MKDETKYSEYSGNFTLVNDSDNMYNDYVIEFD